MALIKCPECGKEVSDKSKNCIHCGYPLTQKEEFGEVKDGQKVFSCKPIEEQIKKNKKMVFLILGFLIVAILLFTTNFFKSKEYFDGIAWGSSREKVERKYPDILFSGESGCYFGLVDSLEGYSSEDSTIDLNFYFDDEEKLYKVDVNIVDEDIGEAVLFFVEYFNKIYDGDYEAMYNSKYVWIGDKTSVSMSATEVLLKISYTAKEY